tara:strand:- start:678 stop:2072 length:1395 start_codon:yes stop_codon:yes gene_type:complete
MLDRNPYVYYIGVIFLLVAMVLDLIDGWFATRYIPQAKLSHLADKIMDKVVYAMIFPMVAVGMMWRYQSLPDNSNLRLEMLHVVFVFVLCVTVLMRDNFAHFMRNFSLRKGDEEEMKEVTRLRTMVAAPIGVALYIHAFYIPGGPDSSLYYWLSWFGSIPIQQLFFLEILLLIINFGSIAAYCRKYGTVCLDEICLNDENLRRRILAVFPNALTIMNALMGILAILFAYRGRVQEAYLILLGAGFFDKLDGALARKLGLTTPLPSAKQKKYNITLGSVLDDISDTVSFCIAPAIIFYLLISKVEHESVKSLPFGLISLMFVILGITRLVLFILDQKSIPGFFKGLPVPGAALFVAAPFIMLSNSINENSSEIVFWSKFCFILMITAALLMVSFPIKYMHIGRLMSRSRKFLFFTIFLIVVFAFTPYFGHVALTYLTLYVFSPIYTWRISPDIASKESSSNLYSS